MKADLRPIGYYVHHQGHGHLARARAIRRQLSRRCILIGTMVDEATEADDICLPDDRIARDHLGADRERSRPDAFHYAPVGAPNVRDRMARLAQWIATEHPACLVVDVSCEIALFARLMSLPVVLVRLAGLRTDTPHLEAFRAADALIAPFPETLDDPDMPAWVREKTSYVGLVGGAGLSSAVACRPRRVVVVLGRGGTRVRVATIAATARATPAWDWQVIGRVDASVDQPDNLTYCGWSDNIASLLAESAIVVGGCGDGLLADVAASQKRFVCLPEDRPFDEQRSKARYLAEAKMAVVRHDWPAPDHWAALLDEAYTLDPSRIASLHDPQAADKAAASIETVIASRS